MRRERMAIGALILAVAVAGAQAQGAGGGQRGGGGGGGARGGAPAPPPMVMTTTSFEDGGILPAKYVGAMGVSPALNWTNVPMGTQSFVLLLHDPDVAQQRSTRDVTHWLVWNIPGTATGLPEGVPQGAELPDGTRQVSLRANGYMGPAAPANAPYHHYTFELFALDAKIDVPASTPQDTVMTREAVIKAIDGHALGKAVLVGRFHQ
jgi:Raf kinase inhibitor-like YbhB/YbcL family protein